MFFRALVLAFAFSGPPTLVLLLDREGSVLRGSISPFEEPLSTTSTTSQYGGRATAEVEVVFGVSEPPTSPAVERELGASSSSTTSTPCPPCECGVSRDREPTVPPGMGFVARVAWRAAISGDEEVSRDVWGFMLLYATLAGALGWWCGAASVHRSQRRSSALAASRLRPRGSGYRAGLEAPGGV